MNRSGVPASSKRLSAEKERAKILERICQAIARRVQKGEKLKSSIARFVRQWDQKPLPSGASLRLSAPTLIRLYYRWRKTGAAAFSRNYCSVTESQLPSALASAFLAECLAPETLSMAGAARRAQADWSAKHAGQPYRYRQFLRRFSQQELQAIRELHNLNRAARLARAEIRRFALGARKGTS